MFRGLIRKELLMVHSILFSNYGDPGWWPGDTPFEVAVGAVLTQNTSWDNVERAIHNLKMKDLISPDRIVETTDEELVRLVRPAGFFNRKSIYLKEFSRFLVDRFSGRVENLGSVPLQRAREELLSVKGIGKETADSILCYGASLPVLVIDTYTWRFLDRFLGGSFPEGVRKGDYDSLQSFLMGKLSGNALFYNRFHALLVLLSKDHCRKTPTCDPCPLSAICSFGIEAGNRTK